MSSCVLPAIFTVEIDLITDNLLQIVHLVQCVCYTIYYEVTGFFGTVNILEQFFIL